ncbi:hypothetical protein HMPREF1207_03927 [Paenibacillus sp. HGH0039]|nr:hypothetical protein HMPREF1207_03927 [Paenibacillus sp. HGH0039]
MIYFGTVCMTAASDRGESLAAAWATSQSEPDN